MTPRYRIRFSGPVAPGLVAWLQRLIPVLREAPPEVEVTIEIEHVDSDSGLRRDEAG